ncbi:MAG: NUDIX domain-containing protein [Ruminococcus sp.]|nr:NUDIX domain-containing protein [Ruminococcus sp.]
MELWDGYNEDRTLAGVDIVRGSEIPEGIYHAVVHIVVRHTDGSFLVTQRDFRKEGHPGEWEIGAGGSVLKGESIYDGAVRELFEETGIRAESLEQLYEDSKIRENGSGAHYTGYLCVTDIDKNAVTLQEGETIDYKWLSAGEIIGGEYVPSHAVEAVKRLTDK